MFSFSLFCRSAYIKISGSRKIKARAYRELCLGSIVGFTAAAFFQRVHESTEDEAASEKVAETVGTLSSRSSESGHVADPLHDFYLKKTTFRSVFNAKLWQILKQICGHSSLFSTFCRKNLLLRFSFSSKIDKNSRKIRIFFLDFKR